MDYLKALQYFEKGSELNNPNCIYSLIKLIEKKNPGNLENQLKKQTIVKLTKKAADLNHLECLVDLGFFYDQG